MNQINKNRKFQSLADLINWAIYLAWTTRASQLEINPGKVDEGNYQVYSIILSGFSRTYVGVNSTLRAPSTKARYTASIYRY